MSRFLKEIPMELLSTGAVFTKDKEEPEVKVSAYMQAKQAFKAKPFGGSTPYSQSPAKSFGKPSGKGLDYKTGDRVRHIKFGEGTVTAIIEGGRDYEVTVAFDTAGTKKMFAAFAKLEKI